jgi:hypothetical protein
MKKTILIFSLIIVASSVAFAGSPIPAPANENPKTVERTSEKPKMVPVEYISNDYFKVTRHFTCGIGFGGSVLAGFVEKDGFGYPKCEYGVTSLLGYGYTWITGQPTEKQIRSALEAIRTKSGALIDEKKIQSAVRDEVGIKELKYVEIGTVAAILPLNAEMGTMWLLNDNVRTRLGFGLPTLISFGINFDF